MSGDWNFAGYFRKTQATTPFEEFKNEQQKFNSEVLENLRMMRKEMTEMKEKQEKFNEKVLEELKTIRNDSEDKKKTEDAMKKLMEDIRGTMGVDSDIIKFHVRIDRQWPMEIKFGHS